MRRSSSASPARCAACGSRRARAGRRRDESIAIFIAYDDPVDQYLMRNPDFVFSHPVEQAIIDPGNPHILAAQLACAARELPLTSPDLAAEKWLRRLFSKNTGLC